MRGLGRTVGRRMERRRVALDRHRCLHLLQAGDGGTGAGLHRRGLLLAVLECRCDLPEERVDLVGVVPLPDVPEAGGGDLAGGQVHRGAQSS